MLTLLMLGCRFRALPKLRQYTVFKDKNKIFDGGDDCFSGPMTFCTYHNLRDPSKPTVLLVLI